MSKMDELRRMREARYAKAATTTSPTRTPRPAPAERPPVAPPAAPVKAAAKKATPAERPVTDELCGHRNMSGRTCTREQGHSAKSHRYS